MALAKDHQQTSSSSFYENMLEVGSLVEFPHISPYEFDDYDHQQQQKHNNGDCFESSNSHSKLMISNSPAISTSSSANSSNNGLNIHHQASNYHLCEEANSLINFKSGYRSFMDSTSSHGSLLNFQNEDQLPVENDHKSSHPTNHHHHPIWEGSSSISSIDHHHHHHHQQQSQLKEINNCTSNKHLLEEVNHLRTSISDYNQDSSANEWVYAEESATQQTSFNKRPYMENEKVQASKKQCRTNASKKPAKLKSVSTLKDPQSVAAKNRRERISERLKILQDLVPNGSKVDMVTMLEKAIGYVKFLQLQVKVLATDEFWPGAGGKAPDISQVKEAIDAILSSQRNGQTLGSEAK